MRHRLIITLLFIAASITLRADVIPVRYPQGTLRGFLLLRSTDGKILANGELLQTLRNGLVTLRLTFHFRDGSLDDQTTVFSQNSNFKLISDHHIQKGPTFPHPIDLALDTATGQVTSRSTDKDGKEKVTQDHVDVTPDLSSANLLSVQILNLPAGGPEVTVPILAPTAKPRLVKAAILQDGETFVTAGSLRRKAISYRIKIQIGGVAGAVAPIVGKAPSDSHVWIIPGNAPAFVRQEGQFFEGGPIWTVEQTNPTLPRAAAPAPPKSH